MKIITRVAKYTRINDKDGNVSLTNLLLIVMIVKFAFAPSSDMDMVALVAAMLNYFGKKWLETP